MKGRHVENNLLFVTTLIGCRWQASVRGMSPHYTETLLIAYGETESAAIEALLKQITMTELLAVRDEAVEAVEQQRNGERVRDVD
jgi:hypothetical protein